MDLYDDIKTAYDASVPIALHGVFALPAATATFPVMALVAGYVVTAFIVASFAAKHTFLVSNHARPSLEFLAASVTSQFYFVAPARSGGKPLPSAIAGIFAASFANGYQCGDYLETVATDRASLRYVATAIVTVMVASVLMKVNKLPLLAGILCFWYRLAAAASASNYVVVHGFFSCGYYTLVKTSWQQ